jgi:ribosome-associated protein
VKPFVLAESDYTLAFVKSAGPGGQNVNKLATAAQLRFDLAGNTTLGDSAKARLRVIAGRRLTDSGEILIIARDHRTQEGNRREALDRLHAMIAAARVEPKARRATKPTRASKEKRLAGKARDTRVKRLRGRVRDQD